MKFIPDDVTVSPEQEWLSRVSPFLPAADPHQVCIQRAWDQGVMDVNEVCSCDHDTACTKPCCRPDYEE